VEYVLGVDQGCLAVFMSVLGCWEGVMSVGTAAELATGGAAAAAEVRGLASVA